MLADISTRNTRNTVSGKVILKETGVGIPDLIVIIFDLDPVTGPDGRVLTIDGSTTNNAASMPADRIGSVITSADGSWALPYDDSEFQASVNEKRPDLWILVQT